MKRTVKIRLRRILCCTLLFALIWALLPVISAQRFVKEEQLRLGEKGAAELTRTEILDTLEEMGAVKKEVSSPVESTAYEADGFRDALLRCQKVLRITDTRMPSGMLLEITYRTTDRKEISLLYTDQGLRERWCYDLITGALALQESPGADVQIFRNFRQENQWQTAAAVILLADFLLMLVPVPSEDTDAERKLQQRTLFVGEFATLLTLAALTALSYHVPGRYTTGVPDCLVILTGFLCSYAYLQHKNALGPLAGLNGLLRKGAVLVFAGIVLWTAADYIRMGSPYRDVGAGYSVLQYVREKGVCFWICVCGYAAAAGLYRRGSRVEKE